MHYFLFHNILLGIRTWVCDKTGQLSWKLRTQGVVHLYLKYIWLSLSKSVLLYNNIMYCYCSVSITTSPEAVISSRDQSSILSHFQSILFQITWITMASEESIFHWKWWQSNERNVDGGAAECATHPHSGFRFCWLLKGSVGRGISVVWLLGLCLTLLHMFLYQGFIFCFMCIITYSRILVYGFSVYEFIALCVHGQNTI